jgi:Putative metallopeptidase
MLRAVSTPHQALPKWLVPLARVLPLMLISGAASAQTQTAAAPAEKPHMQMGAAMQTLSSDPGMKGMSRPQLTGVLEFVAGNMVFVLQHEMGHAQISERNLPVLGGKDEDAADVFAILTMLQMKDEMSYRVLERAAMGWFLTAKRDEKSGSMLTFYDAHGLDRQRAYQIVCLMVGSDPEKFKGLADGSKLPKDRQRSCANDFKNASAAWEELLQPFRRGPDQPKVKMQVVYGEGKGKLDLFARTAKAAQLLETLADFAEERFAWRAPLTLEMRTCGDVGASYNPFERKVHLCYELAEDLAQVYRKYGKEMKPSAAKRKS